MSDVIISERCGSSPPTLYFAKTDTVDIGRITPKTTLGKTLLQTIKNFFCEILLPYGYPNSVSSDYFQYQLWDTLQAFCSTITAAFTTRAILTGVGVGNANASAVSATVTWIMKDGTGMLGRIVFAWWKGSGLDSDCKKWRLFADFLNDVAMFIELLLPYYTKFSMYILCLTTGMKSIVGIAGGATRASITHHQAIRDNMAEISAKDGSQETLVNLVASFTSIFLLSVLEESLAAWIFIFCVMCLHLLTNYYAVTSLIFKNFNDQRFTLVLRSYFNIGTVPNPEKVNAKESVILGRGYQVQDLCGFRIKLGEPLHKFTHLYNSPSLRNMLNFYNDKSYCILPDLQRKIMYVTFEPNETTEDVLAAYFHAACLAIAVCSYNGIELDMVNKRQLFHKTPITRLNTFMKRFERNSSGILSCPNNLLDSFKSFVEQEISMFFTALQINSWEFEGKHSLKLGEWRAQWRKYKKS